MRKFLAISLCFASLGLVACTNNNTSSSESILSMPTFVSSAESVQSEVVEMTVNTELVNQIGQKNAILRELYTQECYAGINGMGAATLYYYEPYICYTFVMVDSSSPWIDPSPDGIFSENPFIDNLEIMQIHLKGDYDAKTNKMTDQGSLAQLFETDGEITYELISESLGQTPEFVEYDFYDFAITEFTIPGGEEGTDTSGYSDLKSQGYQATFTIDEKPVVVTFIKNDDKYVAYDIVIGEMSTETQTLPETQSSASSQAGSQNNATSQNNTTSQAGGTGNTPLTPKR